MTTSTCACCGNPTPGPREWGWCTECDRAGCVRLRSDAEGGDVRRGRECPRLQREARAATMRGLPTPMHLPAARVDDDVDEGPMTTRERDRLAVGPDPRARVTPPGQGERCPRCHRRGRSLPCLLCAPQLVPIEFRTDLDAASIDAGGLRRRGTP